MDIRKVRIGVVVESPSVAAQQLAAAFAATRFLDVTFAHDRREVADRVVAGELRGFVVIPQEFEQRLAGTGDPSLVKVVPEGPQPTTTYNNSVVAGMRVYERLYPGGGRTTKTKQ